MRCFEKSLRAWRYLAAIAMMISVDGCSSPSQPSPQPQALTVTCPANASAQSADGNATAVSFELPRSSGGTAPVSVSCAPQAGSAFPVGASMVNCQAQDARGQTANCSFGVNVQGPPRLTHTRFLSFGDSLTEGVKSAAPGFLVVSPVWSYPFQLQSRLTARYRLQTPTVINEGMAGERAAVEGLRRFRGVLQANRPEVVLLMEGTNDLLEGEPGAVAALNALRVMIAEAKSQSIRIALATIPPQRLGGRRDAVARSIPGFNDRVRALAASEGVPVVEVFNGMNGDNSLIGIDDLHMTERGYEVMADIYLNAIRTNFEQQAAFNVTPASLRR